MNNKKFILALILCTPFYLFSQNWHLSVGTNMGATQLFHNINFKETPLESYYETVAQVIKIHYGENYTWQDFTKDFGLSSSFPQIRFGFSADITYKDWPLFATAEIFSSPSTYTKIAYSGTIGVGKYFTLDDESWSIGFHSGYKYVYDSGFGSSTLINAVRNTYMRNRLSEFFNPSKPLGSPTGYLFVLNCGVAKSFDKVQVGADIFGELDLVNKTIRSARMTNVGVILYCRFKIF